MLPMLSENAVKVLERRYFAKDEQGSLTEDAEGMFRRVAKAVAVADARYDEGADTAALAERFYQRMATLAFMPNSPTLMNAGRPLGQLSACFVLPVPDSMEGIFDAVKNAALIHKSGGGTGFSFSRLRPTGAQVASTGGVASGPISFMKVFNTATEAVKQGGTRRGANMGILRVDHPDIEAFISCKQDDAEINNFNISIGITEAFMRAAQAGESIALVDPRTGETQKRVNARELFEKIVDNAWKNGEPGIIFLDRLNRDNVVPHLGEIESTNPCGEQPLLPYESCNLGSLNLAAVLTQEDGRAAIDWHALGELVDDAVHFLDNIIDINHYPLPEIDATTKATRKVGLGVMGWADMLFALGLPYDGDEAVALADKLMGFIQNRAVAASRALAGVRGAFPEFSASTLCEGVPVRNATVTTIAPTGTISIICDASSGIEPLFALAFVRNVMDNDALPQANPAFEEALKRAGCHSPEIIARVAAEGTCRHIEEIPQAIRDVFVTAHDISPEAHIRMQAAFQRHTDNAVSKTVNFINSATRQDVAEVFRLAWQLDCKGVTIYRDGSRFAQVLYVGKKDEASAAADEAETEALDYEALKAKLEALEEKQDELKAEREASKTPRPRPEVTMGITEKVRIGCGNLYVTVNYDEQGICEVFATLGRAGGCPSQSEATSRLLSIALRSGMRPETLIEQLRGIRCLSTIRQRDQGVKVLSCPDAIGRVLERVVAMQQRAGAGELCLPDVGISDVPKRTGDASVGSEATLSGTPKGPGEACPECGAKTEHASGCVMCRSCGYSKCN